MGTQESTTSTGSRRALITQRSSPAAFWKRGEPDCTDTREGRECKHEGRGGETHEKTTISHPSDRARAAQKMAMLREQRDVSRMLRHRVGHGVLTRRSSRSGEGYFGRDCAKHTTVSLGRACKGSGAACDLIMTSELQRSHELCFMIAGLSVDHSDL